MRDGNIWSNRRRWCRTWLHAFSHSTPWWQNNTQLYETIELHHDDVATRIPADECDDIFVINSCLTCSAACCVFRLMPCIYSVQSILQRFHRAVLSRERIAVGSHPSVCLSVCDGEVLWSMFGLLWEHSCNIYEKGQDSVNVRQGSSLLAASDIINLSK